MKDFHILFIDCFIFGLKMRVFANLCYLQSNGIQFFKVLYHYKVERRKNLYLLFTIWLFHILMPIAILVYQLFERRQTFTFFTVFFVLLQKYFSFSISWSVSFLMWNVSVHVFENLVKLKNILLQMDHNSGEIN